MNLKNFKSVSERRQALEKALKLTLPNMSKFSMDEKVASVRNCENMIGAVQVPVGIAGPLIINYQLTTNNYFIPLATTEGALVASVNRGCKAITESGGADVEIETIGATRGPVFRVENVLDAHRLATYLQKHFDKIKQVAEKTSSHLTLKKFDLKGAGKYRFVRFYFDTQDAMGLNMITIATNAIVDLIRQDIKINCVSLSGNFCVDKKPAWQNFINQRGIAVRAEVILTHDILQKILKTKASVIYETWLAKCMLGSAMSGSMGFNAQYANVIAAMFIATGQDPAHVVEGSMGITTTEIVSSYSKKDLYISIYLPSLLIGTVGGGTAIETQQEALSIMGVSGGNQGKNSQEFARIIGAAVLAGEISLLASLSEGSLAKAHIRLARSKT